MRMASLTNMTDTQKRPSVPGGSGTTAQSSGQTGEVAEGAEYLLVRTGYCQWKQTAKPLIVAAWNMQILLDRKETNQPERRTALVTRELR